jgi:hypothetical protein
MLNITSNVLLIEPIILSKETINTLPQNKSIISSHHKSPLNKIYKAYQISSKGVSPVHRHNSSNRNDKSFISSTQKKTSVTNLERINIFNTSTLIREYANEESKIEYNEKSNEVKPTSYDEIIVTLKHHFLFNELNSQTM